MNITDEMAWKLVEACSGQLTEYAVHKLRTDPNALEPYRAALTVLYPAIAAAERERAAKIADELSGSCSGYDYDNGAGSSCYDQACAEIASSIRAMKD